MKMKLPALLGLCLLAVASPAGALQTDELIAITTMPLAVADVVALPDVPREEVLTVVTTLNQAAVPAPQFVEIVRYVPVALLEPAEPRFVTYVTQEYRRGIVGEPLALAIADRYDAYGIDDIDIADPPVLTIAERTEILPQVVTTRFQPVQFDPLALIAMPLAVAAVAEIADVPQSDLMRLVASLNQALVPAPQFVEVVRYSPVVLVDRTETPQFIRFVTAEVDRGVIGRPLAFAIAERIETYQPVDIDVVEPRRFLVQRDELLPPVVVTRVARAHPHGGPPGLLKKERGLRTGAEVVHGTAPNRVAAQGTRTRNTIVRDDAEARDRKRVTRKPERPRVVRAERADAGDSRVRQERPRKQRAPKEVRLSGSASRGNAAAGKPDKGKDQGKDKGNGKGKG